MMLDFQNHVKRIEVESHEKWVDLAQKIPFIKFPSDWEVQVIPPFGGAIARFRVKLPCGVEKSIYADFYESLGFYGEPYWEVYPVGDDCGRCAIHEVDKLLEMIADIQ